MVVEWTSVDCSRWSIVVRRLLCGFDGAMMCATGEFLNDGSFITLRYC